MFFALTHSSSRWKKPFRFFLIKNNTVFFFSLSPSPSQFLPLLIQGILFFSSLPFFFPSPSPFMHSYFVAVYLAAKPRFVRTGGACTGFSKFSKSRLYRGGRGKERKGEGRGSRTWAEFIVNYCPSFLRDGFIRDGTERERERGEEGRKKKYIGTKRIKSTKYCVSIHPVFRTIRSYDITCFFLFPLFLSLSLSLFFTGFCFEVLIFFKSVVFFHDYSCNA